MITAADVIASIIKMAPDYVLPTNIVATIDGIIFTIPGLTNNYYNGDTPGIATSIAAAIIKDNYNACPKWRVLRLSYLTLYNVTESDKNDGSTSDIKSLTEGDLTVQYTASTATPEAIGLGDNSWGQKYYSLVRDCSSSFTPRTAGFSRMLLWRCF